MHSIPHESGVYQILCVPTGKVYVGSASDLYDRWREHRWHLKRGTHHSLYLQRAWDKYGETAFEFSVIELVPVEQLLEVEQRWIDATRCYEEERGFNICVVAGSQLGVRRSIDVKQKIKEGVARTWDGFINPNGERVTITNLYDFCREHGLSMTGMRALYHGKKPQYRGWTHVGVSPIPKPNHHKVWEGFISPDGILVDPIENLHKFCKDHGLRYSDMHSLYTGKILSSRGWKHIRTAHIVPAREYIGRRYEGFINPERASVIIDNLARFCRENGVNEDHMRQVYAGIRKSHKGWTCIRIKQKDAANE